jgi:hypothetical protein
VGGPFREKGGGGDVVARRVLTGRSVFEAAVRLRHRTFNVSRPYATPGGILGLEAGFDTAFKETSSEKLVATAHMLGASLGSQGHYARVFGTLKYRLNVSTLEGFAIERSVLAAQVQGGIAGSSMPVDQQFAPGGSPDMELPLRAHPQDRDGALGATPLGRSLALVNLEWRRRLVHTALLSGGIVFFYDAGRIARAIPGPRSFHDIGLGLRLTLPGAPIVRVDYGHGLTDGAHALFFGLGEVF